MIQYSFTIKIVFWLSIRNNIIENQIRSYLADSRDNLTARLVALVNNAPAAAQASLTGPVNEAIILKLKVVSSDPVAGGLWEIYPKIVMKITVADTITLNQVRTYLDDYWDQAKTDLRNLVANAPPGANAKITEWHVHRLSGSVDEVEV